RMRKGLALRRLGCSSSAEEFSCTRRSAGSEGDHFSFFNIFRFAGKVARLSFRFLLRVMLSAYISKIFSPLRSRSTAKGHMTPPPMSRYLEKRVASISHSLSVGLRRL